MITKQGKRCHRDALWIGAFPERKRWKKREERCLHHQGASS